MEFKPYPYQAHCIEEIIRKPFVGLFLDMGLGKTVITLTALRALKWYYFAVNKTLIVAPKKVAEDTWQTEAAKWDHLQGLRIAGVLGSAEHRRAALKERADIYVINRENVPWLVQEVGTSWPFDTVVLDESSSFKNHRAKRFRALKAVRPKISRLIELTGTPSPHGLMDLWAQVYLLDGGKRLGRTITCYREAFFVPDQRSAYAIFSYKPRAGAAEAIEQAISDICISMKAADYLTLPEIIYEDVPVVLDDEAKRRYTQLEREAVLAVDDAETITAASAAALSNKLLQLCNGTVYDEDGEAHVVHDCKLEALAETVEQLNGQHAIVCYSFRADIPRILDTLAGVRTGAGKGGALRVRVYKDAQDKDAWNRGEVDILLLHPASAGYGLNLQDGGHHIIWYGLTWALELYQQTNKRLHRQGQRYPVIVHHLVVKGGRDENVLLSLADKDKAQEHLIESLKAKIAEVKASAEGATEGATEGAKTG